MRRDDLRSALDAMASDVDAPSTGAGSTIQRGRRRIRARRFALAGVVTVLVAAVASVGALARTNDTSRDSKVETSTTTATPIAVVPSTTNGTRMPSIEPVPTPLAFPSAREGWLCSDPMQYTDDGGKQWRSVSVPSYPPALPRLQFPVCAAIPGGEAWLLTGTPDPDSVDLQILHVTHGGADKEVLPFPRLAGQATVRALSFADSRHGWVYARDESAQSAELYATDDGGHTWSRLPAPVGGAVQFTSSTNGWAGGGPSPAARLSRTTDGGRSWHELSIPVQVAPSADGLLVEPHVVDASTIVAAGLRPDGHRSSVFFAVSADGGKTWDPRPGPSGLVVENDGPHPFNATDADHWQLGDASRLWTTSDGGHSWTQVADFAGVSQITQIAFPTPDVGYVSATGEGDTANATVVLETKDGGATWTTADSYAPASSRSATVVNFPGGIIGCPTRPLTPPPPGNPPAGLLDAARRYVGQGPNGWTPNNVQAYHLGANPPGSFGYLFRFQVASCGPPTMANGWVVEMHGAAIEDRSYIPRAYLVFAHYADGWQVFGLYP